MAIQFPNSPGIGSVFTDTDAGFSYEWTGVVWKSFTPAASSNVRELDDISSSFDNSTTTFNLTIGGAAYSPLNAAMLQISLGGVIQEPSTDYTVSTSTITFTTAPNAGLDFFGVVRGTAVAIDYANNGNVQSKQEFTATEGQTSFTVTGGYTAGYIDVYRNGVRLAADDITISSGTAVVLATPAQAGDIIETIKYQVASIVTTLGQFTNLNISGIATVGVLTGATSIQSGVFYGDGSALTGIDATSLKDSGGNVKAQANPGGVVITGIATATGFKVGTAISVSDGAVSATRFHGDGSNLTGIDATSLKDSGGNVKAQANPGGVVITGVATATTFVGNLTGDVTGDVTGNTSGTAGGLTGTPNITVGSITAASGSFSGNISLGGTLTYQDVTNVDSIGIITAQQGIQVLANGLDVTGFSTFKTGVNVTGVVTATSFSGDGSALTGIEAAAFLFNTGVSSSITLAATGIGTTALTLPSTAGKQYIVHSILASNVSTGNTEVNFVGAFDFNSDERSYFAKQVPIPTGMSVEMLKQPQVLNPSDRITVRSTDYDRNGTDGIIDVFISFEEKTSTDLVGLGKGVSIAATTAIGIFTSTSNPSVIQSIRLANVTDAGGKVASIIVSDGVTDRFIVDNLVVPKYASIEVLDNLKRIETNHVIKIQVDEAQTIDVQLSAKKITS